MASPLVSAIIPTHNRQSQIQRAIESVLSQKYDNLELIIIDDGSKKPISESIEISSSIPHQIIRHEENQGANVARTTGIEVAEGDYLAFLDSDDEWMPDKISQQVRAIRASPAHAAYTAVKNVDTNGGLIRVKPATHSGDIQKCLLNDNVIGTFSTLLISSEAVDDVGYPDPNIACWQDWEWYLRLSDEIEFVAIPDALTIRHNEGEQISTTFGPRRNTAYRKVRKRIRERTGSSDEERKAIAHLTYRMGYAALSNHQFSAARSYFIEAIKGYPWNINFYKHLAVSGRHYPIARGLKRETIKHLS